MYSPIYRAELEMRTVEHLVTKLTSATFPGLSIVVPNEDRPREPREHRLVRPDGSLALHLNLDESLYAFLHTRGYREMRNEPSYIFTSHKIEDWQEQTQLYAVMLNGRGIAAKDLLARDMIDPEIGFPWLDQDLYYEMMVALLAQAQAPRPPIDARALTGLHD